MRTGLGVKRTVVEKAEDFKPLVILPSRMKDPRPVIASPLLSRYGETIEIPGSERKLEELAAKNKRRCTSSFHEKRFGGLWCGRFTCRSSRSTEAYATALKKLSIGR